MTTIIIQEETKAAKAFLEYCKTLPFVKIQTDNEFENPSPSGDTYWDNPNNVATVLAISEELKKGKIGGTLSSKEDIRKFLGL